VSAWRLVAAVLAAAVLTACTDPDDRGSQGREPVGGVAGASATSRPRPSATATAPVRSPVGLTVAGDAPAASLMGLDHARAVVEYPVASDRTGLFVLLDADADAVGPLRSATPSDATLALAFAADLVTAGATGAVVDELGQAGLGVVEEHTAPGALQRDPARRAPFNLYALPAGIRAALGDRSTATRWPAGGAGTGAAQAHDEVTVAATDEVTVIWTWDPTARRWLRTAAGELEQLATGERVGAGVVVVVEVPPRDRPPVVADLIGAGAATVLRDGTVVAGRWTRDDPAGLPTIDGLDDGAPAAGTLWLHLCATPCSAPTGPG
jgi:hypothetical protein